jgi:hypothetical protein
MNFTTIARLVTARAADRRRVGKVISAYGLALPNTRLKMVSTFLK